MAFYTHLSKAPAMANFPLLSMRTLDLGDAMTPNERLWTNLKYVFAMVTVC